MPSISRYNSNRTHNYIPCTYENYIDKGKLRRILDAVKRAFTPYHFYVIHDDCKYKNKFTKWWNARCCINRIVGFSPLKRISFVAREELDRCNGKHLIYIVRANSMSMEYYASAIASHQGSSIVYLTTDNRTAAYGVPTSRPLFCRGDSPKYHRYLRAQFLKEI